MIVNDRTALAELTAAFHAYEQALMTNDVAALDAVFRQSPETLRFGVGENLYGFQAIAEFRRNRPGGSPQRTLRNTVITTYGDSYGTANTEFLRENAVRIGRQSQCWVKFEDGWRVVAAHISMLGEGH